MGIALLARPQILHRYERAREARTAPAQNESEFPSGGELAPNRVVAQHPSELAARVQRVPCSCANCATSSSSGSTQSVHVATLSYQAAYFLAYSKKHLRDVAPRGTLVPFFLSIGGTMQSKFEQSGPAAAASSRRRMASRAPDSLPIRHPSHECIAANDKGASEKKLSAKRHRVRRSSVTNEARRESMTSLRILAESHLQTVLAPTFDAKTMCISVHRTETVCGRAHPLVTGSMKTYTTSCTGFAHHTAPKPAIHEAPQSVMTVTIIHY